MLYLLVTFFPPVIFFQANKAGAGFVNLLLWLSCCGSPFAIAWAWFEVSQYMDDVRTGRIVDAIENTKGKSRQRDYDDDSDD